MKIRYIFVFLLLFVLRLPAASGDFFRDVRIRKIRSDGSVRLAVLVRLKSASSLQVYYDPQKPSSPDNLKTFWFDTLTKEIRKEHTILLGELVRPGSFYFRLEKKTGPSRVSPLYLWDGKKVTPVP